MSLGVLTIPHMQSNTRPKPISGSEASRVARGDSQVWVGYERGPTGARWLPSHAVPGGLIGALPRPSLHAALPRCCCGVTPRIPEAAKTRKSSRTRQFIGTCRALPRVPTEARWPRRMRICPSRRQNPVAANYRTKKYGRTIVIQSVGVVRVPSLYAIEHSQTLQYH